MALEPSLESIWRIKCRQYSITYNTPLHVVTNELDPMFVLQALYEEQYSPSIVEEEYLELLDRLYTMRDPNYTRISPAETESLVDAVLNKELARAAKKKKPTQENIQAAIKEAEVKPKSGGMNFESLEKLEADAESNKSGFEDQ